MSCGNVVVINGTSSAGKTSIAKALQEIMERPYLHTGIDHFLPRLPARCVDICGDDGQVMSPYFLLVYKGGSRRTIAPREGGEAVHADGVLSEVRIGPEGLRLLSGV